MTRNEDRIAVDYVREVLADIRKRLAAGAKASGTTLVLNADECRKLLGCLKDPPYPAGAPIDSMNAVAITLYYAKRLKAGVPAKRAVADTMQRFRCSRSTVFAARASFKTRSPKNSEN
jgi:hypothetical protein